MPKTLDRAEFESMDAFGVGAPNPWGANFIGDSFISFLTPRDYPLGLANVTFECRTAQSQSHFWPWNAN